MQPFAVSYQERSLLLRCAGFDDGPQRALVPAVVFSPGADYRASIDSRPRELEDSFMSPECIYSGTVLSELFTRTRIVPGSSICYLLIPSLIVVMGARDGVF